MAGHEITCGGFRIGRQIGVGGQALVCEATCIEDRYGFVPVGSSVALKVAKIQLPPDQPAYEDEQTWERLRRRVDDLRRLDHPNVVRYYGCFSEIANLGGMDGVCRVHVIVMELLKGTNLKDWLSRYEHNGKPTGLDADDALSVIRGAVAGLSYTSRFGLVHRDIKPANIFVCEDGTVKIIDFGLAAQENVTQSTNVGGLKGTLNYMAPEFTEADFRGDETSDVFSMGVVMHQLVTGNLPYDALIGKDGGETLVSYFSRWMAVKNGGPSPVLVWPIISRVLTGFAPVVEKALSPAREARYATFAELEKALAKVGYCEVENGRRRYRYLRMVGKGGFGEVFKARDLSTGSLVAVKRLFNMSSAARFEREAKTLKLLQDQDRCFVRFVDFFVRAGSGVSEGEAFLVMEYLDGMPGNSLREAINSAARTPSGTLDKLGVLLVFERYARGLAVMHRNGIIHRDIKPSNLYFANGRPESAVIMDFGIVRDLNAEQTTGNVPCTLDYAPPEIVLDENERGHAGMDIYALGHCLYEALTGKLGYERLPSGVPGYTQFIQRVHNKVRPKFADPAVRQDRKLMELLDAMTALDPVKRLSSADVVAQALREIINGIEHLNDVTIPLDREAARKMWEKHHPDRTEPVPMPPVPHPVSVDRARPRRWIWLALLGAVAVCAAYFVPVYGPVLVRALGSGAADVPPPVRPPAEIKVQVTVPQLEPDVKCYFNENQKLSGATFAVRPGEHAAVYRRFGYQEQEVAFAARAEEPEMALPKPGTWEPNPVSVRLPSLDGDVTCRVDGKAFSPGGTLLPGQHEYRYERSDYLPQGGKFVVEAGVDRAVPAPGEWRPEPVEVAVPLVEADVKCEVDGRAVAAGSKLSLTPGTYRYAYSRSAHKAQGGVFAVSVGKLRAVPSPGKWEPESKPVPPPPDRTPVEIKVQVTVPQLGPGVKCYFNEEQKIPGAAFSVRPGEHVAVYRRYGYREQEVSFAARTEEPVMTLPNPNAWEPDPVSVRLPSLEEGVTCSVDGKAYASGQALLPGRHKYRYERRDYLSQGGEFVVTAGVERTVPAPDEWRVAPVEVAVPVLEADVKCEVDGRSVASGSKLQVPPGTCRYAYSRPLHKPQGGTFVVPRGKPCAVPPPGTWELEDKPAPPPQALSDALFNYDNEEFYEAVRCFAEAVKGGWRLTAEDLRKAKHAYNTTLKKLGILIENIEHDMSLGRTPIRPLKEVQDERKNLLAWRRIIEPRN